MTRVLVRQERSAFTLVEVLLVVVIIGVLAGILVPRLSGHSTEARISRARADIQGTLSLTLDLFEQDVGRYPTTDEGLSVLVEDPGIPGWKGPYLKDGLKPDPWGTPYSYAHAGDLSSYVLRSAGPDRELGTEDDVVP